MAGKLDAVVILLLLLLLLKNSMTNLHGKLGPTLLPKTDPYSAKNRPSLKRHFFSFFFFCAVGKDGDCGKVDLKRDKGMVIILSSSGESSRLVFATES